MPRFAANLGYLFTERPLLERIDAAAAAGFKAVELQFPYVGYVGGVVKAFVLGLVAGETAAADAKAA